MDKEKLNEIKDALINFGDTISVAESLTGGALQKEITSISGASKFFKGGITTYCLDAKRYILNVDYELGRKTNCVSQKVADQMAKGALNIFNTSYSISTCGYAEVDTEHDVKQPYAFITIVKSELGELTYIHQDKHLLSGAREAAQKEVVDIACNKLHEYVTSINK